MQLHFLDDVGVQGLKGAQADVQCDSRDGGAGGVAGVENFRREVEPGGGGGNGAAFACENGLVALAIGGGVGAADVRRQWDVTGSF